MTSRRTKKRSTPSSDRGISPLDRERALVLLKNYVRKGATQGKVPLFIIGAGVSRDRVPMLRQIGQWLHDRLQTRSEEIPDREKEWILSHAQSLADDDASRHQVAELFSTLQGHANYYSSLPHVYRTIWLEFSRGFLIDGLQIGGQPFEGLVSDRVKPSVAHAFLAEAVNDFRGYVVSLNFDGLTHQALKDINDGIGLALHTRDEVIAYFAGDTQKFTPAVFKVRGDVFYARCVHPSCPGSLTEYPLDRLGLSKSSTLQCPSCGHEDSLRLHFSFPGYRAKEEAAHPMLWTIRRFIASSISTLIIIGLSGRWDRYLLEFLLDLAKERGLLVAHVDPCEPGQNLIEDFRASYYPSVVVATDSVQAASPAFVHIPIEANEFTRRFREAVLP